MPDEKKSYLPEIKPRTRRTRDVVGAKELILTAALHEFSEKGYSGARVDQISKLAGVSKPMIYEYFGDKDGVYAAALQETYIQIREGENSLKLSEYSPDDAIEKLVRFTMDHFRRNPWFISMLNNENLRQGATISQLRNLPSIQSKLVEELQNILKNGEKTGLFCRKVNPIELYIKVASLCYFPISNRHTLENVFEVTIDDTWLDRQATEISVLVLSYLKTR